MTDQPTFEYRDEDGDSLTVRPTIGTLTDAILLRTPSNAVCVPLDRVEEVIAGIRDAARTAAARQTTPTGSCGCGAPATPDVVHRQGAPCYMDQDGGLQTVELPTAAAHQTTGQDDTDCPACGTTGACNGGPCAHPAAAPWTADGRHGPTPEELRQAIARAIHRYDNQHALSGNDIPSEHHYGEADAVLAVLPAPAVGQPAEAHDTDRAAALHAAADRVALDLTPTGGAAIGYRHAIADVVRLLRRLGDEEATR